MAWTGLDDRYSHGRGAGVLHGLIFARRSAWTHALQMFAVLQEWRSVGWFISFIANRSPHILPRVQFCIIPHASRHQNSVSPLRAPLACPERLSANRNVVEQHGKAVLRVPNYSLSCHDLVHYFRQRRSGNLCALRSNLQPQIADVFAIDHVAGRGCLRFGSHERPTSSPPLLLR